MKNISQQKIYDVNDRYGNDIEVAKAEYVKTGKRVDLNIMFQNLRLEMDRIVDEYFNMSNYYINEFKNKTLKNEIAFDMGKYYYFQTNAKVGTAGFNKRQN